MTLIKDRTILITGGASGIGKLMAQKCLLRGAKQVVLWDINTQQLAQTRTELSALGTVHTYTVDVSQTSAVETAAQEVQAEVGDVDILFNNAGVVVGKLFSEHTARDIDLTVSVNVAAVMHMARVFLPAMIAHRGGHIINIASASSYTPNPKMSVYAASKWAVLGWSESLRIEMEREQTGVRVTTVLPSYINTGMFNGVKSPLLTPILTPEYITERILRAVERNRLLLLAPWTVHLLPIVRGLLPARAFDWFGGKVFGIYDTMRHFAGRSPQEAKQPEKPLQKVG